jgi:hypothetical protein
MVGPRLLFPCKDTVPLLRLKSVTACWPPLPPPGGPGDCAATSALSAADPARLELAHGASHGGAVTTIAVHAECPSRR